MRASRGLKWENKMYKLKRSIPEGLVWDTNMAAVPLFRDTNMAAVTSRENALYGSLKVLLRIPFQWVYVQFLLGYYSCCQDHGMKQVCSKKMTNINSFSQPCSLSRPSFVEAMQNVRLPGFDV